MLKNKITPLFEYVILFIIGGFGYNIIELLYRGYTDPTMTIAGGICFILCGIQNEFVNWDMPLVSQQLISAILVTIVELIFGVIFNIGLGMEVWDYSNMPYNFMGQICLLFTVLWFFLSLVGIFLDDFLRYKLFGEEKPHYVIFGYKR